MLYPNLAQRTHTPKVQESQLQERSLSYLESIREVLLVPSCCRCTQYTLTLALETGL